ncbi:Molybdopterin-synthase adenylyltransferase (chloroplast) [Gracilaria domingensis]|uniref:molybdopterin biosynthesis protein n=1 Tax=Gracilaria domingensis TaxID=172961 RepID=UPI001D102CB4|nr:molybdopterin biosynthesis protein [Gracilaria domingensis]KAI0556356.1 Molybdopterin-synthase adenylyltransferase [Gracilaria domingensis]UAD85483.1 molybdopterin biosynthesis protein [Gracilaria domingensis]
MFYPVSTNHLSEFEYKKYARHLVLENIGDNGQKRLKAAKVLFIGAGGLAASGIIYLASSGVGCLGIVDDDQVAYSNLHRQILYKDEDIGQLKVNVVRDRIKDINSQCSVHIYSCTVDEYNCRDIIKNYDIVIDTTDNFQARYIISRSCYLQNKIHIYGAVQAFEGHISVFNYKSGPLYSDLYPKNLNLYTKKCSVLGVLGVLTGIIGTLQVVEAMKIVLGIGNILSGYLLVYNLLDASFKTVEIVPKMSYKYYYDNKLLNSNLINQTSLLFKFNQSDLVLIDVRQPEEFGKYHLSKAINIPLKNIKLRKTIDFIRHYIIDKTIVIYCYDNLRSLVASQILYKNQIKHYCFSNR